MRHSRRFKWVMFDDNKSIDRDSFNWAAWYEGCRSLIASSGRNETQGIGGGPVPGHTFDPSETASGGLQNGFRTPVEQRKNSQIMSELRSIN